MFTARQGAGHLAAPLGKHRKQREDAIEIAFPAEAAAHCIGAHFEVLEHRQRGENLSAFRHMGDPEMGALGGRNRQQVAPFECDPAGGG